MHFTKEKLRKKLLAGMKRHGGTMVEEDLAKFSSEWVEPISTTYRDWTVYELRRTGKGGRTGNAEHMETFPLGQKDMNLARRKRCR